MLVDGVLRMLDIDKRDTALLQELHKNALSICRETGAVLDLAISDVDIYLETASDAVAKRVRACYPGGRLDKEAPTLFCIS